MIGVTAGALIWLGVQRLYDKERLVRPYIDAIVAKLEVQQETDCHRRVDKVRTFINDNSVHKEDDEFHAMRGNPAAFAAGIIAHAEGHGRPVHMECSSRAGVMIRVLRALGYETRHVFIFDSHRDKHSQHINNRSHTMLDVLNPATGRWETQDPEYDIYWRRKADGERVSLVNAAEQLDELETCGRTVCGWNHVSRDGNRASALKEQLDIISVTDEDRGLRFALYTSRTNLNQVYTKERKRGLFCEVAAKHCRDGFSPLSQ